MGQRGRHFGDVPGPGCKHGCTFVDLIWNYFVKCVGLAVMGLAVMGLAAVGRILDAEVGGHAGAQERHVIGRAEKAGADRLQVEDLAQRLINLLP